MARKRPVSSQSTDPSMRPSGRVHRDRRMPGPATVADTKRRRKIIGLALFIPLLILGIISFGYWDSFVDPPQGLAARVGDNMYTQGDLVDRVRILQADAAEGGDTFLAGREPFRVLEDLYQAGIIIREAPGMGIVVTEPEIEMGLLIRFGPRMIGEQEVLPGQIKQEYKENYQRFLNRRHISDDGYRRLIEERLYRSRVREKLGESIPSSKEHYEVYWIKLPTADDASLAGSEPPDPLVIRDLLLEEDFSRVAAQHSVDTEFADNSGYVGWVPIGAFEFLDNVVKGDDNRDPIPIGEISPAMYTDDAVYILTVVDGPEIRVVDDVMMSELKDREIDRWLLSRADVGGREGWFELRWNSDIYAWVVNQVQQTARQATLEPTSE